MWLYDALITIYARYDDVSVWSIISLKTLSFKTEKNNTVQFFDENTRNAVVLFPKKEKLCYSSVLI